VTRSSSAPAWTMRSRCRQRTPPLRSAASSCGRTHGKGAAPPPQCWHLWHLAGHYGTIRTVRRSLERAGEAVSQSPRQRIRPVLLLVLVGMFVCAPVGAKPSRAANPSPRSALSLSAGLIGPAGSAVPPYGPAAGTELGQLPILEPGESA